MSSPSAPSKRLSLNICSPTGPKPLHLVDGTAPDFHSWNERQSFISYKRSSYDSSSHTRPLDKSDLPTREAKPRPRSVAYPRTPLSPIPRDRRSLGAGFSTAGLLVEDRPPLTLAEKHADLLRFIAQKESKCLELRSQLAAHESELLQLKHKWERIVSRGFESPHSFSISSSPTSSSTTHSPPTTYTSASNISASTPNSATTTVADRHTLSTNSADANTAAAAAAATTTATTTIIRPRLRQTPTPLKPRERPHSLYFPSSHSPGTHIRSSNLSTSSSSTTTTSGTRFSATSLSSASSFFFEEEGPEKQQDHGQGQESGVERNEKGAEQKPARRGGCDSDRDGSPYSSSSCSHELMVRDTGATPTVSPNPKFMFRLGRRKERERERRKEPDVGDADRVDGGGGGDWTDNGSLDGVSILGRGYADDGGPAASSSAIDAGSTRCHRRKSREASSLEFGRLPNSSDDMRASSKSNRTAMLVNGDPASFEGGPSVSIASHNGSGSGTSQTQPLSASSWTSRGWGSTTLTKSQKRASHLFSDVSQTLVSAFSSMAGTGPTSRPAQPPTLLSRTMRGPASPAVSLLDQDEEDGGFFSTRAALEPMKPIVVGSALVLGPSPNVSRTEPGVAIGTRTASATEDEEMDWGW